MDIQSYLNRINYRDEIAISKEVLFNLQAAHLLHVPFENLDIHYKTKINLDIASIYNKIVINRRGGFCYELNGLFYHLLKSLGFYVHIISGRVCAKDGSYGEEYDHLAIIAHLDGKDYLVDVGFGKFSIKPLEISFEVNLSDEFGLFRFDKAHDNYISINLVENGNLVPQYVFEMKAREFMEFKQTCIFHQTSDKSHFTKKKVVSIFTTKGRITLNDNQVKISSDDIERIITFKENEFEFNLKKYFNIEIKSSA